MTPTHLFVERTQDPWQVGATIDDRWEIFGAEDGGMGRVFFVRDRSWGGMPMAVKTLKSAAGDAGATVRELFRRETQTWLDLGAHPHIVSGFYTLELDGALRFFMEYVPGRSLERRAASRRPSMEETLDLAIQIAFGMEYVHARGVVHRDLKPANCLVLDDGSLRVTDFGLGRSVAESDASNQPTELGIRAGPASSKPQPAPTALHIASDDPIERMGAGTPAYMAPEQWRALQQTNKPGDVYSFGVLLYELLAGAPPFFAAEACYQKYRGKVSLTVDRLLQGENPIPNVVLRALHEQAEPAPLREHGVTVPGPLETVVRRCLDKDPDRRPAFGRVREMLLDLFDHILGRPYARKLDAGLEPSEAGENNRAVSYSVMGDVKRSKRILERWLAAHPLALYPWINRRIAAVEDGEEDAASFAAKLETVMRPVHAAAFESDRQVIGLRARLRSVLMPLGAPVDYVTVSPGADRALLVGERGQARVFAVREGDLISELGGHGHRVVGAAFSPDGARVVTASWDRTARVYRARARGEGEWPCERVLQGPRAWMTCAAWSPDSAHIVTGSEDGSVIVWDADRGRAVHALERHESSVQVVAWSPDRAHILTGTRDGVVRVIRFPEGDVARELPPHGDHLELVSFLQGGRALSAGRDGVVRTFSLTGDDLHQVLAQGEDLFGAAVSETAGLIAVGTRAGRVRVFRLEDGAMVRDIEAHEGPVRTVTFIGEGKLVLSGAEDGTGRVWGSRAPRPPPGLFAPLICAPIAASERVSLAHRRDELVGRLRAFDVTAYEPLQALRGRVAEYARDPEILTALARAGHGSGVLAGVRDAWVTGRITTPTPVTCLAFAPDGRLLAGGEDGVLRSYKPDGSPDAERRAPFDTGPLNAVAVHGDTIAAASTERVAAVWDAAGQPARPIKSHAKALRCIALSPDGERIATGGDDLSARLYRRDGALLRVLEGHRGPVVAVAFTPDDRSLLTASTDGVLRLFSLDSEASWDLVRVTGGRLETAAFRRDGRLAAVRTSRSTAQIYDVGSGKLTGSIPGHTYFASPVAFSPRGRMLLTGSDDFTDRSARLWDTTTGALHRAFDQQPESITAVAVDDDALRIAIGARDGSLTSWQLDCDFRFHDDLLTEAETMCDSGRGRYWVIGESADARAWLDVWQDLRRSAPRSAPEGPISRRMSAIGARVRARIEALDRADSGFPEDAFQRPIHAARQIAPELWSPSTGGDTSSHGSGGSAEKTETPSLAYQATQIATSLPDTLPTRVALQRVLTTSERLLCGAFSPAAGEVLVLGSREGVTSWQMADDPRKLGAAPGEARALAISPDGARLAVASERALRLHSMSTGALELQVASAGEALTSIAMTAHLIVAGTRGSRSLVYDPGGPLLRTLGGHTDAISGVAVSPGETHIVTAGLDGTLRIWRASDGAPVKTFAAHAQGALCVTYLEEERILSGGCDGRACLWDLEGRLLASWQGSPDDVTAVAVRQDGRVIATAGRDRVTRLWDVAGGNELLALPAAKRQVVSLSFSRAGRLLIVAGPAQVLDLE